LPTMRSALSSLVGGAPGGTVTVGAVPNVPAGDRSAAGMGPIASSAPPPGAVVGVERPLPLWVVDVALEGFDGEELQADRPNAPAVASAAATNQGRDVRGSMARDGTRCAGPDGVRHGSGAEVFSG
jgi:hypothetical protein